MIDRKLSTLFAPAERTSETDLRAQSQSFSQSSPIRPYLDAIPEIFLILNEQRQVVYANQSLLDYLGIGDTQRVFGLRPGEILECSHAFETEGGCGTTEFCQTCGAAKAILASLRGEQSVQECRILKRETGEALDLRVWATPYRLDGNLYSIFVVSDISHEKRRQSLERIFYHDVLNTAGGLLGFARLLREADSGKIDLIRDRIYHLANKLIEEIKTQRELSAAENNELAIHPESIHSAALLQEIACEYANHDAFKDRILVVDPEAADVKFESDRTLLSRVIGNLVKNALEASLAGETVTLGCRADESGVAFWVRNPAVIPREVQLQIFQRSFSTKGSGRGLGTYSIKLLSERYLKGSVFFTSTPGEGTVFTVHYPWRLSSTA